MAGKYATINGRKTYFPPFVNERFGRTPWWACTFTALLNGANVGFLGAKPATHDEVRRLARASGDEDLRGGSRSSHMIRALQKRYGVAARIQHLDEKVVQRRLGDGWAMVAGVTYGDLPDHFRRWSPRFQKGHRVTVLGFEGGKTRLLDPLANKDEDWTGEWIAWPKFARAWWSREQLWFKEGQFVARPTVEVVGSFEPPRNARIAAGATVKAYTPDARTLPRSSRFDSAGAAKFDALVQITQSVPGVRPHGRFLHISSGIFAGLYVAADTPGITADTQPPPSAAKIAGQPEGGGAAGVAAAADISAVPLDIEAIVGDAGELIQAARLFEYERIRREVAPGVVLPDPPAGP
jgi:hypothetical protein